MNNLVLVRHGQSKFNLERRFTGFYDVELTSQGAAEAKLFIKEGAKVVIADILDEEGKKLYDKRQAQIKKPK